MLNGKLNLGIPNIGIYNLFAENLIGKLHDKNKKIIINMIPLQKLFTSGMTGRFNLLTLYEQLRRSNCLIFQTCNEVFTCFLNLKSFLR